MLNKFQPDLPLSVTGVGGVFVRIAIWELFHFVSTTLLSSLFVILFRFRAVMILVVFLWVVSMSVQSHSFCFDTIGKLEGLLECNIKLQIGDLNVGIC